MDHRRITVRATNVIVLDKTTAAVSMVGVRERMYMWHGEQLTVLRKWQSSQSCTGAAMYFVYCISAGVCVHSRRTNYSRKELKTTHGVPPLWLFIL